MEVALAISIPLVCLVTGGVFGYYLGGHKAYSRGHTAGQVVGKEEGESVGRRRGAVVGHNNLLKDMIGYLEGLEREYKE